MARRVTYAQLQEELKKNPNLAFKDLSSGQSFGSTPAPQAPGGILGFLDTIGGALLSPLSSSLSGFAERGRMDVKGVDPNMSQTPGYVSQERFEDIKNNRGLSEIKDILSLGSMIVPVGKATSLTGAALRGAGAGSMAGVGLSKEGEELQGLIGGGIGGGVGGAASFKLGQFLKKGSGAKAKTFEETAKAKTQAASQVYKPETYLEAIDEAIGIQAEKLAGKVVDPFDPSVLIRRGDKDIPITTLLGTGTGTNNARLNFITQNLDGENKVNALKAMLGDVPVNDPIRPTLEKTAKSAGVNINSTLSPNAINQATSKSSDLNANIIRLQDKLKTIDPTDTRALQETNRFIENLTKQKSDLQSALSQAQSLASPKNFDDLISGSKTILDVERFDIGSLNKLQQDALRRRFKEFGIAPNTKNIKPSDIGANTDRFINEYMTAARSYGLSPTPKDFSKMFSKLGQDRANLVKAATEVQKSKIGNIISTGDGVKVIQEGINPEVLLGQAKNEVINTAQKTSVAQKTADDLFYNLFGARDATKPLTYTDLYEKIVNNKMLESAARKVNESDALVKPELAAQASLWNKATQILKENVPGYQEINRIYQPLYNQMRNVGRKSTEEVFDNFAPKTLQSEIYKNIIKKGGTRAEGILGDILAKVKGDKGISGSFSETLTLPGAVKNLTNNINLPNMNIPGLQGLASAIPAGAGQTAANISSYAFPRALSRAFTGGYENQGMSSDFDQQVQNMQLNVPQNFDQQIQNMQQNVPQYTGGFGMAGNVPMMGDRMPMMGRGEMQGGFGGGSLQEKLMMASMTGAIDPEIANSYIKMLGQMDSGTSKDKKASATIVMQQASKRNAIDQLHKLSDIIAENANNFGIVQGGPLGDFFAETLALDPKRAELKTTIAALTQIFGKALEGGRVTDADIARYQKMMPNLLDPAPVAQAKLKGMIDLVTAEQLSTDAAMDDAGYRF